MPLIVLIVRNTYYIAYKWIGVHWVSVSACKMKGIDNECNFEKCTCFEFFAHCLECNRICIYTLVVIPGMCVCMHVCYVYASVSHSIEFHLISFAFWNSNEKDENFQKKSYITESAQGNLYRIFKRKSKIFEREREMKCQAKNKMAF